MHFSKIFGAPRASYSKVVNSITDKKNLFRPYEYMMPGPGYYNDDNSFRVLNHGPKFSFRPRTHKSCTFFIIIRQPFIVFKLSTNPGPGTYDLLGLNTNGRYSISTIRNVSGPTIKEHLIHSRMCKSSFMFRLSCMCRISCDSRPWIVLQRY